MTVSSSGARSDHLLKLSLRVHIMYGWRRVLLVNHYSSFRPPRSYWRTLLSCGSLESRCYPTPPCLIPRILREIYFTINYYPVPPTRYPCERTCLAAVSPCSWTFSGSVSGHQAQALGSEFPASCGISGVPLVQHAYTTFSFSSRAAQGSIVIYHLIHLQSQRSSSAVPRPDVHLIHPILDILQPHRIARKS